MWGGGPSGSGVTRKVTASGTEIHSGAIGSLTDERSTSASIPASDTRATTSGSMADPPMK